VRAALPENIEPAYDGLAFEWRAEAE
jgi:hypothetical protein